MNNFHAFLRMCWSIGGGVAGLEAARTAAFVWCESHACWNNLTIGEDCTRWNGGTVDARPLGPLLILW